jgi:hypothetical protein
MTDQKSAAEVRVELEEHIAVVGLRVAVDAAIEISKDPKASGSARTAAINALLRAGGLGGFARNFDPAAGEKEPHEMTVAELDQSRRKLQLMREAREAVERQQEEPRPSAAFD